MSNKDQNPEDVLKEKDDRSVKRNGLPVRFTDEAYAVIKRIAEKNNRSMADVVRMCVDDRLMEYLLDVYFIDSDQEIMIRKLLFELCTELNRIRFEINKIGVNINQRTKLINALCKSGKSGRIEIDEPAMDMDAFSELCNRFEDAAERIGQELSSIFE